MLLLHELLRKPLTSGEIGLEIECEGSNLRIIDNSTWTTVQDGSLRGAFPTGACEYVLKKPILGKNVKKAIELLKKDQLETVRFDFSFRTSVHVHVNVGDLTMPQLLNFIYTYTLLESPLMRYCGEERQANRFCLRIKDAEAIIGFLKDAFRKPELLTKNNQGRYRYSAMNLEAIFKYGSVEFRGMKGNLEAEYIENWTKALLSLKEFAKRADDPHDIHDVFISMPPSQFMETVLKDVYPFFSYQGEENDIIEDYSVSVEIPHSFKGWKDPEQKKADTGFFDDLIQRSALRAEAVLNVPPAPPPVRRARPMPDARVITQEEMQMQLRQAELNRQLNTFATSSSGNWTTFTYSTPGEPTS